MMHLQPADRPPGRSAGAFHFLRIPEKPPGIIFFHHEEHEEHESMAEIIVPVFMMIAFTLIIFAS